MSYAFLSDSFGYDMELSSDMELGTGGSINNGCSSYNTASPYRPLLHPRAIRLVTILPGAWPDDVRCELTYESLDSCPVLEYRTLSYVWGSARVGENIWLDGLLWKVTVNLACALRYLRGRTEPVTYWIDALVSKLSMDRGGGRFS